MVDSDGQGWHGDPEGHKKAGEQSGGNPDAAENMTDEDRAKGGSASGGNFKNDPEKASEAGKIGGSK